MNAQFGLQFQRIIAPTALADADNAAMDEDPYAMDEDPFAHDDGAFERNYDDVRVLPLVLYFQWL